MVIKTVFDDAEPLEGFRPKGGFQHRARPEAKLRAIVEMDEERRKAMLIEAMEIAIGDYSTIPVLTRDVLWGARRDRVSYIPRKDEETNVLMMRRLTR